MADRRPIPPMLDRAAAITWRALVVAVGILALLVVLSRLRIVVLPVIVALMVATVLVPPVHWLRARGWPPLLATWAVLLGFVVVVVLGAVLVGPSVVNDVAQLGDDVEAAIDDIRQWLVDGPLNLSQEQIDRYYDQARDEFDENRSRLTSGVVSGALLAGEIVAGAILALVLAFFFVKDGDQMAAWFVSRVDPERRETVRAVGQRAWAALGGYIRGQVTVAVVDAVLIGIGLAIIGVPLVIPLAFLTFLGGFFPLIGATVAGVVAALVALASGGVGDALLVGAVVIVVQQVEGDVLAPVVLGRAVQLHPVVVLLALTTGGVVGGIVGAFVAVPLTGVLVAVGNELRVRRASDAPSI